MFIAYYSGQKELIIINLQPFKLNSNSLVNVVNFPGMHCTLLDLMWIGHVLFICCPIIQKLASLLKIILWWILGTFMDLMWIRMPPNHLQVRRWYLDSASYCSKAIMVIWQNRLSKGQLVWQLWSLRSLIGSVLAY